MVLVLSFNEYEQCTDPVIDWLLYYKVDFIKLTQKDLYDKSTIQIDIVNNIFMYRGINLVEKINCIYYRRFEDVLDLPLRKGFPLDQVKFELKYELKDLIKYIYYLFKDKIWFPNPNSVSIDKLTALSIAKSCGLRIPSSTIINNKNDALNFISKQETVVTKPIRFSGYFVNGNTTYNMYTNKLQSKELFKWNVNIFFPTLLQEKITKEFEIRTFYLDGEIYASAIFVDNENYDDIKRQFSSSNIKWLPFKFPKEIETKIQSFMNRISLNTGSIDMIKKINGDFIFIEVNPVGQFIAPSGRCNYYLEKKIANWLKRHDNK